MTTAPTIDPAAKRVTLELDARGWPAFAQVIGPDSYLEVSLEWEGRKLVDFTGAMFLPEEVKLTLREAGLIVPDNL